MRDDCVPPLGARSQPPTGGQIKATSFGRGCLQGWTTGSEGQSYLWSELLYKIYDAYVNGGVPESQWPFGVHDGNNDEAERVDLLVVVLMSKHEIFDAGGSVGLNLDMNQVFELEYGERFFGNLAQFSTTELQGIYQLQDASEYQRGVDFDVARCSHVVLHEFTHTLGFGDGPPPLQEGIGEDSIERYYYGKLNNLCQKFMPGRGPDLMGLFNLARTDWIEVVDFTGQNLLDQTVYDIRSFQGESQEERGKIFKFRCEKPGLEDQYFLFAYHAGRGVDAAVWPGASEPVLISKGLEIRNRLSNRTYHLLPPARIMPPMKGGTTCPQRDENHAAAPKFAKSSPNSSIAA